MFGLRLHTPSEAVDVAEGEKPLATAVDLWPSIDHCWLLVNNSPHSRVLIIGSYNPLCWSNKHLECRLYLKEKKISNSFFRLWFMLHFKVMVTLESNSYCCTVRPCVWQVNTTWRTKNVETTTIGVYITLFRSWYIHKILIVLLKWTFLAFGFFNTTFSKI